MKIIRVLVLLAVGFIWVSGCSSTVLNELYRAQLIPDDYRFGDLYRLSNLSQFRDPAEKCPPYPGINSVKKEKVALYIIGDSFTEERRIGVEDFVAGDYQFAHWATELHLKLDTSYTNIIILESVERKVREHFASPIHNIIPDTATFIFTPEDTRLVNRLDRLFMSVTTEERLATVLFQFDSMLKIKELKSWINYTFFDRTDPKVAVSENGKVLAYIEDTDSTLVSSSFNPVHKTEVDSLVQVLNFDKVYLESLGFDEVWFSIIPNKASVLMPEYGTYNHLLERVEGHPALKVPAISVYQDFKAMGLNTFLKGDSHWTCAGQYKWLEKVNNQLYSIN